MIKKKLYCLKLLRLKERYDMKKNELITRLLGKLRLNKVNILSTYYNPETKELTVRHFDDKRNIIETTYDLNALVLG